LEELQGCFVLLLKGEAVSNYAPALRCQLIDFDEFVSKIAELGVSPEVPQYG